MSFALDPAIRLLIAASLALLFGLAGVHKLRDPRRFAAILKEYRTLPGFLLPAGSRAIGPLELAMSAGLLVAPARDVSAAAAGAVLLLYGLAMSVNLLRGRRHLDCGCGPANERRPIAPWMVLRNVVLAAASFLLLLPAAARSLAPLDALTIAGGLAVVALLGTGGERLLAQAAAGGRRSAGRL